MDLEQAKMWARLPKEMQLKILQLQADLQALPEESTPQEEPDHV